MDRYGGSFGAYDDAPGGDDRFAGDIDLAADDTAPQPPPSPVGQDERRMQVRAYNHWSALLGDADFPDIAQLHPQTLDDFGPYGVLLDFTGPGGIEDPAIPFLGAELAAECGGDARFSRLSEVPGRSLLSRITDHYMQILANQAPIGFEAEFVNQHGKPVLYRGILLPWSRDGASIDYIFGVINWKELADAETADALLAAIEAGFAAPIAPYEGKDMDRMLDLTGFAEADDDTEGAPAMPAPAFGGPLDLTEAVPEEAGEWPAGLANFGEEDPVYTVDYGALGLEDGDSDDDVDGVIDPLADEDASLGLASLVSRGPRVKQSVVLPGVDSAASAAPAPAPAPFPIPQAYEPAVPAETSFAPAEPEPLELASLYESEDEPADEPLSSSSAPAPVAAPLPELDEGEGLYDCLAAARELAQTARSSEDRGRKALYQAVARAYDFSLEAAANPDDFSELLAENGLTAQDRAPMTPIVKLVFGADYDKTRLTEYATVLSHAHRTKVSRGALDRVLASAPGGLKGVVQAERQARKGEDGRPANAPAGVRASLVKKLRKMDAVALADLDTRGAEFALVMVRRLPDGTLDILGALPDDIPFVEKAARKLLG